MNEMIFLPKEEVKLEIRNAIREEFEKNKQLTSPKLYTINAVAKRLHMSHATIKKLVLNKTIKTTRSGRIEETEIERYLKST